MIQAAAGGQIEEGFKEAAVKDQGEDKIAAFIELDYVLPVN